MRQEHQQINTILKAHLPNPSTHTLLSDQISELIHPHTFSIHNSYLLLQLTLPSTSLLYNFNLHPPQIKFFIIISKGFPVSPPRLHIQTNNITSIAFDDCRNLIYEVLGIQDLLWNWRIRLRDVEVGIEKFLARIQVVKGVYAIARLGVFQMGMVFPVQIIRKIRDCEPYFGFIFDNQNNLKMYIVDISSTHLCLFLTQQQPILEKGSVKIPAEQQVTSCILVFAAELGSITEISTNRSDFKQIQLKFSSSKPQNMHMSSTTTTKKLKLRKGQQFLKKLIQSISKYSITDIIFSPSEPCPTSPKQKQQKSEQKQLLQQIASAQKQLQHKFNKETISYLNDCYQKIVQYYSSNNLPFYAVFVEKITTLLHRVDVRLVMEGAGEEMGREMGS